MMGNKRRFVLVPVLLSAIVCTAVASAVPSTQTDLSSLVAEHRGVAAVESLYPSPEVSDSSFVWRAGQGTYRLGVQAEDHWRVENKNVDGSVWGQYFYRTPDGGRVSVQYNAGLPSKSASKYLRLNEAPIGGPGRRLLPARGGADDDLDALKELLQELKARDQVMPYGALKSLSEGIPSKGQLRPGDVVDEELKAVVTNVRPEEDLQGKKR